MSVRYNRPVRPVGPAVGPLGEPFPNVRRIAVLRGGGLGDLFFALPALEALRAAYPNAEIVLLGSRLHARLLEARPSPVDEVIVLPESDGNGAEPAEREIEDFRQRVCHRPVDLGVQLHGGGTWSNPFLLRLEPRFTVGCRAEGAEPLDRSVPFRYYQNETMRALEVACAAGAPAVVLEPRIRATAADIAAADRVLGLSDRSLITIHPGAKDPRRRWPASNFAAVAAECVDRGLDVVLVGALSEIDLLDSVAVEARARAPQRPDCGVRQLVGSDMSVLCGVLARSAAFVGNDSGPRHLARALDVPTVGVFWAGDVINTGPIGRTWDRVLISWRADCPVCGRDITGETAPRCPHDASVVDMVSVDQVRWELCDVLSSVRTSSGEREFGAIRVGNHR